MRNQGKLFIEQTIKHDCLVRSFSDCHWNCRPINCFKQGTFEFLYVYFFVCKSGCAILISSNPQLKLNVFHMQWISRPTQSDAEFDGY